MPTGPASDLLVSEVFSAIQGEGALVGTRQVFLRMTGCNIRCSYCDQPEALERRPGPCRIEQTPGRRDWEVLESPLAAETVAEAVDRLWRSMPHHSVSVTGGEPLMQSRRLTGLFRRLAGLGMPLMAETNGTLVHALEELVGWLTYVSMDVKLTSVDGERVDPAIQRRFLEVSLRAEVDTWVKIVVGPDTDRGELTEAVTMVAGAASLAPVAPPVIYLQPVTPFAAMTRGPSPDEVLGLQELALRIYPEVRVVPQTHKAIGQL
ncbi:MAG TPA: 7-carboxy-7-deazaguanine synthase QueE [Acidimicrobiales bacterium]|jgi:organic radical activating enzyme|nr:7-carboxy-7-deazaguanine synthase QueE [Acidimicrobiales bacterium]